MPKIKSLKRKFEKSQPFDCPIFGWKIHLSHSNILKKHPLTTHRNVLKHLVNNVTFISNQVISFIKKYKNDFDKKKLENKINIISDFIFHSVIFECKLHDTFWRNKIY